MEETDIKNQIENYHSLKITKSYRGISVLLVSALLALSLLLSFFGVYSDIDTIIYSLIIYIPIIFFVYKGHRWAIISLIALWTLEKVYQIYETGGESGIMPIIWWLIVTPYFWKALKVENVRNGKFKEEVGKGTSFCHQCGEALESDVKFCSKCGAKINPLITQ